jgi:hypothetical protein
MLALSATTDTIQVVLAGNVATNQLQCFSVWRDITTTAYTPGRTGINTNNTTDVNVVGSPASSTQRVIDFLSVYNNDTAAATVTVKADLNGTEYILYKVTLQVGETLTWSPELGWAVYNGSGILKSSPTTSANSSAVMTQPGFGTAALTGVRAITTTNTMAVYMGKAPRALTSVQMRLRVTTAITATITWAEVAIGKGAIVVGGNPTITPVGFLDVSASHNSLGQKTHTINVSAGQSINEGDDLWALIGCATSGTVTSVRATTMADDIQVGTQAAAVVRPSTTIGTGTAYTIDGATILAPWVALIV